MLIVGTGAMACLMAAGLVSAGHQVTMLGSWKPGLDQLHRHGVRLDNGQAFPVTVTDRPGECCGASQVVVMNKAWQTSDTARQLEHILAPGGRVLTLQNGLGNRELLAQHLGADRVEAGVTTLGATMLEPGKIRPAGQGAIVLPDDSHFHHLFSHTGLALRQESNLDSLVWGKLVINAGINPVAAIFGLTNGQLLEHPLANLWMRAAALEAAEVARAAGVRLPFVDPVEAVVEVARQTARNRASMLVDLERGTPCEIEAISGAVVRAGRRYGVATPYNAKLREAVARAAGREPVRPSLSAS